MPNSVIESLQELPAPEDMGLAIVSAFEGAISRGKRLEVSETVRFLPEHCMMQKVHSGVMVHSEGNRVRIEGIDCRIGRKINFQETMIMDLCREVYFIAEGTKCTKIE